MAINSGLVSYPTAYSAAHRTPGLTIWQPVPPPGYAALGCIAAPGDDPPPLTEVALSCMCCWIHFNFIHIILHVLLDTFHFRS